MDNQHRQIRGYRELNQEEIDLMNVIKAAGKALEELISNVQSAQTCQPDPRWVAISKTHFQEGLMALTRSVAKPTSF